MLATSLENTSPGLLCARWGRNPSLSRLSGKLAGVAEQIEREAELELILTSVMDTASSLGNFTATLSFTPHP